MTNENFGIPITKGKLLSTGDYGFVVTFHMGHLYLRKVLRAQLFTSNRRPLTGITPPLARITEVFELPLSPTSPDLGFAQKEDSVIVFVKSPRFEYSEATRLVLWFQRNPILGRKKEDIVDVPQQAIPLLTAEATKQFLLRVGKPVPMEIEEQIKTETAKLLQDGNIQNYYVADTFSLSEDDITKLGEGDTEFIRHTNEGNSPTKPKIKPPKKAEESSRESHTLWAYLGTIVTFIAGLFLASPFHLVTCVLTVLGLLCYVNTLRLFVKEKYKRDYLRGSIVIGCVVIIVMPFLFKLIVNESSTSILPQNLTEVADSANASREHAMTKSSPDDSLMKASTLKYLEYRARPRIVLSSIGLIRETTRPASVIAVIENAGESAATKVRFVFTVCLNTTPTYHEFILPHKPGESADIAPREKKDIGVDFLENVAEKSLSSIAAGTIYLYAYGRIVYSSEVDTSKSYILDFCSVYDHSSNTFHEIRPLRFSYATEDGIK